MQTRNSIDDSKDLPRLAKVWGKRYVEDLLSYSQVLGNSERNQFKELISVERRSQTATKLLNSLNFASASSWSKTEELLSIEIQRHRINPQDINPWKIGYESDQLFKQVLAAYQEGKTPQRMARRIGPACSRVRKLFTANDPRVLGFASMQIHYTGQLLLEGLSPTEYLLMTDYFKVLDDHLYMPLQRAYEAAAGHDELSPELRAVQALLPKSGEIAKEICQRVAQELITYHSLTGFLKDPKVLISSIRDVEMFQIYLCVCTLERNIAAFQKELFPLCLMLYPPLRVEWWLVRLLVNLLEQAMSQRLSSVQFSCFRPYLLSMQELFSVEVVGR